jgi:hypothetical protein
MFIRRTGWYLDLVLELGVVVVQYYVILLLK